jgi:hypothetical protein
MCSIMCAAFSVHWARHSMGSAHAIQAARLPVGLADMPRAHPVGLAITAKLGRRNRSAVVELSWSQMKSCRAPSADPGPNWAWSGVGMVLVGCWRS